MTLTPDQMLVRHKLQQQQKAKSPNDQRTTQKPVRRKAREPPSERDLTESSVARSDRKEGVAWREDNRQIVNHDYGAVFGRQKSRQSPQRSPRHSPRQTETDITYISDSHISAVDTESRRSKVSKARRTKGSKATGNKKSRSQVSEGRPEGLSAKRADKASKTKARRKGVNRSSISNDF